MLEIHRLYSQSLKIQLVAIKCAYIISKAIRISTQLVMCAKKIIISDATAIVGKRNGILN